MDVVWDPETYGRFAAPRAQPFWDLAALIDAASVSRAVDLGCGAGALTAQLADRLDIDEMVGIDSSPEMLAAAAGHARPGVHFRRGDLAMWPTPDDEPVDLVFANASLHWAGQHDDVLRRWVAGLAPGGQLAVQVPANADHPAHLLTGELAHEEPYRSALGGTPPPDAAAVSVATPEHYATVLHELGCTDQTVRLQVYGHVLDSSAQVADWVRGSSLRRITSRLPAELAERFVDAYRRRVAERLGDRSPYFYAFRRILMWARW